MSIIQLVTLQVRIKYPINKRPTCSAEPSAHLPWVVPNLHACTAYIPFILKPSCMWFLNNAYRSKEACIQQAHAAGDESVELGEVQLDIHQYTTLVEETS